MDASLPNLNPRPGNPSTACVYARTRTPTPTTHTRNKNVTTAGIFGAIYRPEGWDGSRNSTIHLPTILIMLDYRSIHFITDEERAEAAAKRRDEETSVYQRRLASLDEWPLDRQCGRSRLVLPTEVAQRVLDDVAAGASLRAIEDKYRALGYPFSRRWLKDSLNDGRLRQMAYGEKHGDKYGGKVATLPPGYEYLRN